MAVNEPCISWKHTYNAFKPSHWQACTEFGQLQYDLIAQAPFDLIDFSKALQAAARKRAGQSGSDCRFELLLTQHEVTQHLIEYWHQMRKFSEVVVVFDRYGLPLRYS